MGTKVGLRVCKVLLHQTYEISSDQQSKAVPVRKIRGTGATGLSQELSIRGP